MRSYTQPFLDSMNMNFIYEYIDSYHHVGLFSDRMTGKSIISQYYLLSYLIRNKNKNAYFTSRNQIHRSKADEILYHINKSMNFEVEYNIMNFKKQTDSRVWYGHMNNLIHNIGELRLDLIVIDEINESEKIKNHQIDTLRYHIEKNGIKLLINGILNDKIYHILHRLGILDNIKIIDDDFIKNTNRYSRAMKINKLMNK